MKKYLILFNLLISEFVFSQLSLKIEDFKIIDENKYSLKISINNDSKKRIAIPIDTTGFKAYFSAEICPEFEDVDYPFLAPVILIQDQQREKFLEGNTGNIGYIDENAYSDGSKHEVNQQQYLDNWMRQENINDRLKAKINLYIMNHIKLLEPKQSLTYQTVVDISNIKYSKNSAVHDKYSLKEKVKYNLSLAICVDKYVYNYLTSAQIEKIKRYQLFKGKIKSNKVRMN